MNAHLKMILFGIGAGIVSAIVWSGVSYSTGMELGWIAWGVGLLVGLAVRLAADDIVGWVPGFLAGAIAILSILAGKYMTARLIVDASFADTATLFDQNDPEFAQVELARKVAAEFETQNKKLIWPEKKRLLTSATKDPIMGSEFPANVWKETQRRWNKLSSNEKEEWFAKAEQNQEEQIRKLRAQVFDRAWGMSFSLFDILWFFLATLTAFRLGSNVVSGEE